MLEPKIIDISGMKFNLTPLKGFKALRLDKKVISLLLPILEGVNGMDSDIDLGKALSGFSGALDGMKDEEYEKFVGDLVSTVQYLPSGGVPLEMDNNTIDTHFQGESSVLYKLMFEVMRYNRFTPFVLVSKGGKEINITSILSGLTKKDES